MEHKITICAKDSQLIDQILNLIKDEQATYQLEQPVHKSSEKLVEIMNQLASSAPIKSIKDPILWQKDVRKDKKLLGRD